jgi:hypothetical protein
MDHAAEARPDCCVDLKEMPSSYLRRLHFDAIVFSTEQLNIWCANMEPIICCSLPTIPTTWVKVTRSDSLKARSSIPEARAVMGWNAGRLLKIEAPLGRPVR